MNRIWRKLLLMLLMLLVMSSIGSVVGAESNAPFMNNYEAIDRAAQSVFLLKVFDEQGNLIKTGSGFVVFDDGVVVTNEHVIDGAAYVVAYSDQYGKSYKITDLIAVDQQMDIAVLKVDGEVDAEPLSIDGTKKLLRGQPVIAIGSPKGVLNTVTMGNISNIVFYSEKVPDAIQFTAAISPGSSGGALFDEQGAVIGVCVSLLKEANDMYYAVPIRYVEGLYNEAPMGTVSLEEYNHVYVNDALLTNPATDYVGLWTLTGMVANGVEMGVETMSMFGLTLTLTLNEDGTCVVASSGIEESGTWQATALGVAITDPTETLEFTYVDEMLVIEEQGSTLMLTREGAAPAVAESVAAAVLTNVAPEAFEGKWQLVSANLLGMDYTAEQLGVSIAFELAAGQGTYIEGDSTGAVYELPVTYTVTEAEGVGTVMDLLYQDETMTEAVVLLSLNMVDDGRLLCVLDVEGMEVRYYFNAVVEEAAAE